MSRRAQIVPAILPKDFAELSEKAELMRGSAAAIQVDVCDGQFVPNATWPYKKHDDAFERMSHEEEGLPGWEDMDYEFDLMVNRPEEVVDDWVAAGAARLVIHAESKGDLAKAIAMLQGRVEVGLALNESTDLSAIEALGGASGALSFVQLMGIDRIGFQGQAFDERVIGRVKQVRLAYPGLPISVDGGASSETIPALIAAGADRLVVGSAIFGTSDPLNAFAKLKAIASS
ncbi:MAG: hypothetical protein KGI69_02880 [Patescibacteria group bacterium]|nr:hypothetical protein [Patescibacteria group bacterium]